MGNCSCNAAKTISEEPSNELAVEPAGNPESKSREARLTVPLTTSRNNPAKNAEAKTPSSSPTAKFKWTTTSSSTKKQRSQTTTLGRLRRPSKNISSFPNLVNIKSTISWNKWSPALPPGIPIFLGRETKAEPTISFFKESARYKSIAKRKEPSPTEIPLETWESSTMPLDLPQS